MGDPHGPGSYDEDESILARLGDPVDIEAFGNLMSNAHKRGMSAADFVREDPRVTSRRTIRKLCLKNRKRSFTVQVRSMFRRLWAPPPNALEPEFVKSILRSPEDRERSPQNGFH